MTIIEVSSMDNTEDVEWAEVAVEISKPALINVLREWGKEDDMFSVLKSNAVFQDIEVEQNNNTVRICFQIEQEK